MSLSLVIMAAGLGSRFGGVKQLAKVGPDGEAFLDYSIRDALAAGFEEVVIIVRSDIEKDVRGHVADLHPGLAVKYVLQDAFGPVRDKPWGTVHAVLSTQEAVSYPFLAINADDCYGSGSFKLSAEALLDVNSTTCVNVAFELGNTVPDKGSVTRGVMKVSDGFMDEIIESECSWNDDRSILYANDEPIEPSVAVSMNLWCFDTTIYDRMESTWSRFYEANADNPKAEVQLPMMITDHADELRVKVVNSPEQWIGVTHPEDLDSARDVLSSN